MKSLNQVLASFALVLCIAAGSALACGCGGMPGETFESIVAGAMNTSSMVFQGEVVGFEYRKGIRDEFDSGRIDSADRPLGYEKMVVKFKVESWWKGDLASAIFLVTGQNRYSDGTRSTNSCEFDFQKGKTYIVFADLNKAAAMPQTNNCSSTREAKDEYGHADAIRKVLGKGTLPNKQIVSKLKR
ncbi:MAG: hypothetical protein IPO41_05095 [Acidobacteria bacterium]|nr:hypothetical protein [Acidobacteriota bacterium]MBP7475296.1 hypothetical protein [Pyrinomonadaceae bacterium]MBP9109599.1 hypothetical protein [Pyrinomonadaceae bacterium]